MKTHNFVKKEWEGEKREEKNVSSSEKLWGDVGAKGKSRGEEEVIRFPPNAKDGAGLRAEEADDST